MTQALWYKSIQAVPFIQSLHVQARYMQDASISLQVKMAKTDAIDNLHGEG